MADPVTIGAISLGATALGSGVSAFGSLMGGQSQSNMYQYQAGIAQMNAQMAKQNADYALQEGEYEAQKEGLKTREVVGKTMAIQAAGGLDVNRGSAADVRKSEYEIGEENQAIARSSAAKKAYGFEVEATSDTAQGQLDTMAASSSKTAGDIGAVSSILGGASSVSSKWLQGRDIGLWGGDNFGSASSSAIY